MMCIVDVAFGGMGEDKKSETRVMVENGRLAINTLHPDFQARLRTTRQGNPRPSERLNAYLANILTVYGHPYQPTDTSRRIKTRIL